MKIPKGFNQQQRTWIRNQIKKAKAEERERIRKQRIANGEIIINDEDWERILNAKPNQKLIDFWNEFK